MKRRELIKNASLWTSGLLLVPPSSFILSSCEYSKKETKWNSSFFSKNSAKLLYEIVDTLIPNTDIPGAIVANVHEFIESYVENIYAKNKKDWFVSELSNFDNKIKKYSGKSFFDLKLEKRIHTLNQIQLEDNIKNNDESDFGSFYMDLKRKTMIGYFNSEIGVTQALNYKPIPGTFKGCIPFEENGGKSWS